MTRGHSNGGAVMGDGGIFEKPQLTGQSDKSREVVLYPGTVVVPKRMRNRSLAILDAARQWFEKNRRMTADPNPFPKFHLFRRTRRMQ